jgi:hypothetical protein
MRLAIEMDDTGRGYGKIHKDGCRDLRDPERLYLGSRRDPVDPTNAQEVGESLAHCLGSDWECSAEEVPDMLAPCARPILGSGDMPRSVTSRLTFLGF